MCRQQTANESETTKVKLALILDRTLDTQKREKNNNTELNRTRQRVEEKKSVWVHKKTGALEVVGW